nr:hypothetical protein BaRGS_011157 [Batillaria attramentaria]
MVCLHVGVICVGSVGFICVLVVILADASLWKAGNVLIANLALTDLLQLIVTGPIHIYIIIVVSHIVIVVRYIVIVVSYIVIVGRYIVTLVRYIVIVVRYIVIVVSYIVIVVSHIVIAVRYIVIVVSYIVIVVRYIVIVVRYIVIVVRYIVIVVSYIVIVVRYIVIVVSYIVIVVSHIVIVVSYIVEVVSHIVIMHPAEMEECIYAEILRNAFMCTSFFSVVVIAVNRYILVCCSVSVYKRVFNFRSVTAICLALWGSGWLWQIDDLLFIDDKYMVSGSEYYATGTCKRYAPARQRRRGHAVARDPADASTAFARDPADASTAFARDPADASTISGHGAINEQGTTSGHSTVSGHRFELSSSLPRKDMRRSFVACTLTMATYLPYTLLLMASHTFSLPVGEENYVVAQWAVLLAASLNCFVYGYLNANYRMAASKLMGKARNRRRTIPQTTQKRSAETQIEIRGEIVEETVKD